MKKVDAFSERLNSVPLACWRCNGLGRIPDIVTIPVHVVGDPVEQRVPGRVSSRVCPECQGMKYNG